MVFWLSKTLQKFRRSKKVSSLAVLLTLLFGLVGNSLTFYFFEKSLQPELSWADAFWYSIISVTTIGYGDFSASTLGARVGTLVFIILIGLSAFSAFLGLLVEGMMQINYKELHGLAKILSEEHILIINFPDSGRVEQIIHELRNDPDYQERDVVVVSDRIETLPFELPDVFFVKGSPLQIETLERAGIKRARMAIVLSDARDPSSDGLVAAIISLIEHLHPGVKTVAECLDDRHAVLFRSTRCDSIVFSRQVVNNLIVQETQDEGIASLVAFLTQNTGSATLYSCRVEEAKDEPYSEVAKRLIDRKANLLAVRREDSYHLQLDGLRPQKGDLVVYIDEERRPWKALARA
ncbi:MAG: ion channel [Vulcanimicrobiota bacterium]